MRWSRNGTWYRLLKIMQAAADASGRVYWDSPALDATPECRNAATIGAVLDIISVPDQDEAVHANYSGPRI
jgi:hypothetical protein